MPRGDGAGPPRAGGRGRGGGRGMGRAIRANGDQPGTVRTREAVRRASHSPAVASIDEASCVLCGACQEACPTKAITQGVAAFKVNAEACRGCGACVEACPTEAIRLQ